MVCGVKHSVREGVWLRNVLYREVFLTNESLSSCLDQICSFSQDALIFSSYCIPVFSPVKRFLIGDNYEGKLSEICEIMFFRPVILFILVYLIILSLKMLA